MTEREVMDDLIRRQDALKPFCIAPDGTRIPEVDCDNFPVEFSVEFIKKHLLSLPSADRPQGEWIDKGWHGDWQFETDGRGNCWKAFECSNCNTISKVQTNFCPNCGAKMLREDD